jgi:hypothetical protein
MRKFKILLKVLPVVATVLILKFGAHMLGFEGLSLNAIFSGIVGANVFLLGFLLSGVLSDYKESEKLPGEIAATLLAINDELEAMEQAKNSQAIRQNLHMIAALSVQIRAWFYREIKTQELLADMRSGFKSFVELDGIILPNYIVRLKSEHANIRRMIIRIHTIRDTNFVPSGYLIAVTTTALILLAMVAMKMEPLFEGMCFAGIVGYVMIFLLFLIRDLDDPFDYGSDASAEDVSLKPLEDAIRDLSAWRSTAPSSGQERIP